MHGSAGLWALGMAIRSRYARFYALTDSLHAPPGCLPAVWPLSCPKIQRERFADGPDRWYRFGARACSDLNMEGAPGGPLASVPRRAIRFAWRVSWEFRQSQSTLNAVIGSAT